MRNPPQLTSGTDTFAISVYVQSKICQTKQLVDGLDIVPGMKEATGMCEDCIYGKQTNRPYDEVVTPETEMLERVHMDLWGPARVTSTGGAKYALLMTDGAVSYRKTFFLSEKSAGGAKYALLMTDGAVSYRKTFFLSEKSAAATLQAVTEYVAEAEKQSWEKGQVFPDGHGEGISKLRS